MLIRIQASIKQLGKLEDIVEELHSNIVSDWSVLLFLSNWNKKREASDFVALYIQYVVAFEYLMLFLSQANAYFKFQEKHIVTGVVKTT